MGPMKVNGFDPNCDFPLPEGTSTGRKMAVSLPLPGVDLLWNVPQIKKKKREQEGNMLRNWI